MKRIFQRLLPLVLTLLFCCTAMAKEKWFNWEKSIELFPGIRHVYQDIRKPRIMKLNIVRVDLNHKNIVLKTSGRSEYWGEMMPDHRNIRIRTRRQSTFDFLLMHRRAGVNMVLAVNASPWQPHPQFTGTQLYAGNLGLVVSEGLLVDFPNGAPAFLIMKNGRRMIRHVRKGEDFSGIQLAVGGFSMILTDGIPGGRNELNSRTAYGLSADTRFLYIVTVDGNIPGVSEGISTRELADQLKFFGAWNALCMDSGESTSLLMIAKDIRGKDVVHRLNCSSDNLAVANSLGICLIHTP